MAITTAKPSARERLLHAALQAYSRDGALVATLDELRAGAGVSVGALYHHFSDRRALATALYNESLAEYQAGALERLRGDVAAREGIEGQVRFHLGWCAANRERARYLLGARGNVDEDEVRRASTPFLREMLAWYRGHAHYGAVRDLPFELVHALWLGPAQEWVRHWLTEEKKRLPAGAADALAGAAWLALSRSEE